jgi:hypothetical protein
VDVERARQAAEPAERFIVVMEIDGERHVDQVAFAAEWKRSPHVMTVGVLPNDHEDERVGGALVANRTAELATRSLR